MIGIPPDTGLACYLEHRDRPCACCGYNLRGLATTACPECGAGLRLALYPSPKESSPAVLGLAAAALGFGCHLPLWIALVRRLDSWADLSSEPRWFPWLILVALPLFAAATLWWWSRCRQTPVRGSYRAGWVLALLTGFTAAGTGGLVWWSYIEGLKAMAY